MSALAERRLFVSIPCCDRPTLLAKLAEVPVETYDRRCPACGTYWVARVETSSESNTGTSREVSIDIVTWERAK